MGRSRTDSARDGGISDNGGESGSQSIATGPDGNPYVVWMDITGSNDIDKPDLYVKRWNGSNWVEVGDGSASGSGISDNRGWFPSIAIAYDGTTYVTWAGSYYGEEIYAKRWIE